MSRAFASAIVVSLAAAGCGGGGGGDQGNGEGERVREGQKVAAQAPRTVPADPPRVPMYEPSAAEKYRNGKRIAGRIAQQVVTYRRGATARDVARAVPGGAGSPELARTLEPAIEPGRRSWGEVIYAQLSGVTPTSLGAMVVIRQRTEDRRGRRRETTRVVDVRLRRAGGPWRLERVGAVGGRRMKRPSGLSTEAQRVLDHDQIWMSDTARWDIYRGLIRAPLLAALARAADRFPMSVAVLRSGHPPSVWETSRISAHTRGAAADIYAVSGTLVIRQRNTGSPAYRLAKQFLDGGAAQIGSPWTLPPGGRRSFTDAVHQDHIHVQQDAGL